MSMPRRRILPAGLLLALPARAQPAAEAEGQRALRAAESELREALRRMDEGSLPGSLGLSRLRQALNEVERAMLRLPASRREGPPWQAAVREVSGALATLREPGGDLGAARAAAGSALATLPALRGEETGG
jgi:hypothetical protein